MKEELQKSIIDRLWHITRQIKRPSFHEARSKISHLTLHQTQALLHIKYKSSVTMKELADLCGVTPATASQLADRLVEAGWASRQNDSDDRRVVRLKLSPTARRHFSYTAAKKLAQLKSIFGQLTETDLRELDRLLGVIEEATNNELSKDISDGS